MCLRGAPRCLLKWRCCDEEDDVVVGLQQETDMRAQPDSQDLSADAIDTSRPSFPSRLDSAGLKPEVFGQCLAGSFSTGAFRKSDVQALTIKGYKWLVSTAVLCRMM